MTKKVKSAHTSGCRARMRLCQRCTCEGVPELAATSVELLRCVIEQLTTQLAIDGPHRRLTSSALAHAQISLGLLEAVEAGRNNFGIR